MCTTSPIYTIYMYVCVCVCVCVCALFGFGFGLVGHDSAKVVNWGLGHEVCD